MKLNLSARKELNQEIHELLRCYQCGTCVSSCVANNYGETYSPRQKILAALYGDYSILSKELWNCVTCNTCNQRCPRGVNPFKVLVMLKNIAVRKGIVDKSYSQPKENVLKTGCFLRLTSNSQNKREQLGLPEYKPINLQDLIENDRPKE